MPKSSFLGLKWGLGNIPLGSFLILATEDTEDKEIWYSRQKSSILLVFFCDYCVYGADRNAQCITIRIRFRLSLSLVLTKKLLRKMELWSLNLGENSENRKTFIFCVTKLVLGGLYMQTKACV